MRTSIRVPATIEPVTGGEAIVSAPAAGRFLADALPVDRRDRVRPGQALGRLEPRLDEPATTGRRSRRTSPRRRPRSRRARAELARAERLLAERAVPARRVEDARRAVDGRRSATARGGGAARAARRNAAKRRRRGGGQCVRAARADRRPHRRSDGGARRSYDEGAPLFRIVAHGSRRAAGAGAGGRRAASRGRRPRVALEIPGRADPMPLQAASRARSGRHRPEDAGRCPCRSRSTNRGGQLLIGQTGTAILYHRAGASGCRRCRRRPC